MKKFIKQVFLIIVASVSVLILATIFTKGNLSHIYFFTNVFKNVPPARPYKQVITKPEGWFKTGQAADLILYADEFNNTGGASNLNHPMKVVSDGKRLIVSDTYNNRVLIWQTIPTQNYTPADVVLGQEDMIENAAGTAADKLRWPTGVATDGIKLAVADAYNNRVLIWNKFPTENGQPANVVVGQPDFYQNIEADLDRIQINQNTRQKKHIWWPWDVMINNGKLFVISLDGSLLVWNSIPSVNYQSADMVLGQGSFSERFFGDMKKEDPYLYMKTPRAVGFDGHTLAVGDYNAHTLFVWNKFPDKSGQKADFIFHDENIAKVGTGITIVDGKIFATMDNQIYVWNKTFTSDNQLPNFKLGYKHPGIEVSRQVLQSPYGSSNDGKHLFVADSNSNRVLIYNKIPDNSSNIPDVVLGQKDFNSNRLVARNSRNNPRPVTDGKSLIVGDDYNGLVQIYKNLPDENSADVQIYAIGSGKNSICAYDGQLYCTAQDSIMRWNSLPDRENQSPDFTLRQSGLKNASISVDKNYVYVYDAFAAKVLIWSKDSFNKGNIQSDFTLSTESTESLSGSRQGSSQISSDGLHLAVADSNYSRVLIWDLPIREKNQQPLLILGGRSLTSPPRIKINLPQGVIVWQDRLFVADTGNNRVLIWSKFPKTQFDMPDIVLGQKDFYSTLPSNAQDGLFMPSFMAFDGHFLWVGEFKWSDRLLRFSVQP